MVAVLQVLLWLVFCIQIRHSVAAQKGPLLGFMQQLRIYGSLFILAVPLIVAIAPFISPVFRLRFVSVGILIVQLVGTQAFVCLPFESTMSQLLSCCINRRNNTLCTPVHVSLDLLQVLH